MSDELLLKWSPSPASLSLPDLLVFVFPDLTLVRLEPSTVLVPLEEEFGNLLLKQRALDLLSVVSKLGEVLLSLSARGVHFGIFCLENNFSRIG